MNAQKLTRAAIGLGIGSMLLMAAASTQAQSTFPELNSRKAIPLPTNPAPLGTVTYETGFDFDDYNDIRDFYISLIDEIRPWGEHPIIWKHIINPGLGFDPSTLDPNQGPILFDGVPEDIVIRVGDSSALDNYEASGAFFDGAGPVDPSGHWVESFSVDGEETAVLAAMSIWKWNSPVYINFSYLDQTAGYQSLVGVIDSVTLSVPSGVPHVVCGWDDPNPPASCPGLVIENVKMTFYSDPCLCGDTGVAYFDSPAQSGLDFVTNYEQSYDVGPILWDPPALAPGTPSPLFFEQTSRSQAVGAAVRGSDGGLYLSSTSGK